MPPPEPISTSRIGIAIGGKHASPPPTLLVDGVPHPFVMRYNGYFCHRNTAMPTPSSSTPAAPPPPTSLPPPGGVRRKRWEERDICKFADDENNVNGEPESRFCLLMGDVQEERDALAKDWKRSRGDANR